jgi:hypothetical protein
MESFEEYLLSKKIEAAQFSKQEPQLYTQWKNSFEQMHPNSFTAQKLFQINSIRRKFPKANNTPS